MPAILTRATAVLLVVTGVTVVSLAQTPTYSESYEVILHTLDVFVTDSRGNPVTGLPREAFEILVNNRKQEITHFVAHQAEAAVSEPATSPRPPVSGKETLPVVEEPPRTVVFFIDEAGLHPSSRARFHKEVETFAGKLLRPNDRSMIVTPSAKVKIASSVTAGHSETIKQLQAILEGQPRLDRAVQRERRELEQDLDRATMDKEVELAWFAYVLKVSARTRQRLGVLHSVVASLAGTEGRKVVVLVTESWNAEPAQDLPADLRSKVPVQSADLRPLLREVAETAAGANITIYALQPEYGLEMAATAGAADTPSGRPGGLGMSFMQRTMLNTELSLKTLTGLTGGTSGRGEASIAGGFRQLTNDLVSYYSLAYRQRTGAADKPQGVVVRVKGRPELTVRSRRETVRKSAGRQMNDQVMAGFLGTAGNELGIAIAVGSPRNESKKSRLVPVDVRIPLEKLTFVRAGDRHVAKFSVHFAAMGEGADFVSLEPRELSLELTRDQHAAIAGKHYGYDTELRVSSGKLQISVGVRDMQAGTSGVVSQTIDLE